MIERNQAKREEQTSIDLRAHVPHLLPYLHDGERVYRIETPTIITPTTYPNTVPWLIQLAGVRRYVDIGRNGPSIASRATEQNKEIQALRAYEKVFGRDSLMVAHFTREARPALTRTTIRYLASRQGVVDRREEEQQSGYFTFEQPGKVLHEVDDPQSVSAQAIAEKSGWKWPYYYGSIDATPLFVQAITDSCQRQGLGFLSERYKGLDARTHTIEYALQQAATWIKNKMDENPQKLLEMKLINSKHHANEGWKDSPDAYMRADGTYADNRYGIASIEVQGYAYDALLGTAELYTLKLVSGNSLTAAQRTFYLNEIQDLQIRAATLKQAIIDKFWIEDERGGYFALATERDATGRIEPLRVRTSNMGHLLNSRLLAGDDAETLRKRELTVRTLFSEEMLSSSGIRTLSSAEKRFSPYRYHRGAVWLWDNLYIAEGLERQGYYGLGYDLKKRVWRVVDTSRKLPEFVNGGFATTPELSTISVRVMDDKNNFDYRAEKPPQEIQAWSVAGLLGAKYQEGMRRGINSGSVVPIRAITAREAALEAELLSG